MSEHRQRNGSRFVFSDEPSADPLHGFDDRFRQYQASTPRDLSLADYLEALARVRENRPPRWMPPRRPQHCGFPRCRRSGHVVYRGILAFERCAEHGGFDAARRVAFGGYNPRATTTNQPTNTDGESGAGDGT